MQTSRRGEKRSAALSRISRDDDEKHHHAFPGQAAQRSQTRSGTAVPRNCSAVRRSGDPRVGFDNGRRQYRRPAVLFCGAPADRSSDRRGGGSCLPLFTDESLEQSEFRRAAFRSRLAGNCSPARGGLRGQRGKALDSFRHCQPAGIGGCPPVSAHLCRELRRSPAKGLARAVSRVSAPDAHSDFCLCPVTCRAGLRCGRRAVGDSADHAVCCRSARAGFHCFLLACRRRHDRPGVDLAVSHETPDDLS